MHKLEQSAKYPSRQSEQLRTEQVGGWGCLLNMDLSGSMHYNQLDSLASLG